MPSELLSILKEEGYRWGDCQVLRYDAKRVDVFPQAYVTKLYNLCRGDGKHSNILPNLFCGMSNLDHDSITTYLLQRPLLILAVWRSNYDFAEAGIAFPVLFQPPLNVHAAERMSFSGYGYFRDWWGTPEITVLSMLGLAYIFTEFNLSAIHGVRYPSNQRTACFLAQFGFKEVGRVPRYQMKDGVLVDGVVSTLLIEDFESYVERKLLELVDGKAGGEQSGKRRRGSEPVRTARRVK